MTAVPVATRVGDDRTPGPVRDASQDLPRFQREAALEAGGRGQEQDDVTRALTARAEPDEKSNHNRNAGYLVA